MSTKKDEQLSGASDVTTISSSDTKSNSGGLKPRGFYAEDLSRYKDQDPDHYTGAAYQLSQIGIKYVFGAIAYTLVQKLSSSHICALFLLLLMIATYQHVVVFVAMQLRKFAPEKFTYGELYKMDPMDSICYLGTKEAHVNYVNVSQQDVHCADAAVFNFTKLIKLFPKFQFKIKQIGGDYYYEKMSQEETIGKIFLKPESPDKVLRSQSDIDQYIRDNMNIKCPLDGPLLRIYRQDGLLDDQDYLPEDQKTKGIVIVKAHHSFCDGVSVMTLPLCMAEKYYSRDFFIKSSDAKWYQELMIKLLFPLQLPSIVMNNALRKADDNFITRRKDKLSGQLNIHTTKIVDLRLLKALSKKINVAINDLVLSALSTAMYQLFQKEGEKSDRVSLSLAANIRFRFYPTVKDVKLENKFAAIPVSVPLRPTMEEAYPAIKQASKHIKNSFSSFCFVFGTYFVQKVSAIFASRFLMRQSLNMISEKFTLAFSNVPGPIKPFLYEDEDGRIIRAIQSTTYISLPGRIGFSVACTSFCNSLTISVSCDKNLLPEEEVTRLATMIYQNLQQEISKNDITLDTFNELQKQKETKVSEEQGSTKEESKKTK